MIIFHYRDAATPEESTFFKYEPDVLTLIERDGRLYRSDDGRKTRSVDARAFSWFAVPEQVIPPADEDEEGNEIPRKVKELNLMYFKGNELTELRREWRTEIDDLKGRVGSLESVSPTPRSEVASLVDRITSLENPKASIVARLASIILFWRR